MPCKSGWPSGVLATWAGSKRAVSDNAVTITVALVPDMNRFRIFIPPRLFAKRVLPVRAVQQFFHKLDALEIQKLRILFLAPIERHTDFPGSCEDVRILDGCLVGNLIGAGARLTLHHVQLVA